MNKKQIAGIGIGLATLGGGTAIQIDNNINPYTETSTKLEIVADSLTPEAGSQKIIASKDEPKVTLTKWNDEVALGVKYTGISQATQGSRPFLSKNVHWKDGDVTLEVVPIDPTPTDEGGMEINVLLDSKPATNVFTFQLENWENLDFFYQPALTPEEVQQGAFRPDNVIGSYAVYHKTKANHMIGDTNYATGKAYHIYRPKVFDDKGNEVWADMSYSDGVLSVTVPQDFLDNAVYPVIVDPTFGYTSQGASDWTIASSGGDSGAAQPSGSLGGATITDINAYLKNGGASADSYRFRVLGQTGSLPNNSDVRYSQSTQSLPPSAYTLRTVSSLSVTLSTNDWAVVQGFEDTGSGTSDLAYDTGGSSTAYLNNLGAWVSSTDRFSLYATYTPPPVPPIPKVQINAPVNINSNVSI